MTGSVYPKRDDVTVTGQDTVTYGRLCSWTDMMNGSSSSNAVPSGVQGICPTGWHVPSAAEWDTLTTYVNIDANGYRCNGDKTIAKSLASTTGWSTNGTACNVGNATESNNATGFSAVPAGGMYKRGNFNRFGMNAYFWSATESDGSTACNRYLNNNYSSVYGSCDFDKNYGFSVRCLKD